MRRYESANDLLDEDELAAAVIGAIPWLISAVSHLVLMIALTIVAFAQLPHSQIVEVELGYAEELDDPLEFHSPLVIKDPDVVEEPVIEPHVFWEDLFETPHIDLDIDSATGIRAIGGTDPRETQNGIEAAILAVFSAEQTP